MTSCWRSEPQAVSPSEGEDYLDEPDTQSAVRLRYAEGACLFHTPDGEAYATVPVKAHRETHAVWVKGLRFWLLRRFYEEYGKPPGPQALKDALRVLEARALFDGEECSVHVRVAEHEGAIYIDLANDNWRPWRSPRRGGGCLQPSCGPNKPLKRLYVYSGASNRSRPL